MRRLTAALLAAFLSLGLLAQSALGTEEDFTDVPANDWCHEAVQDISKRGLMRGTGEDQFNPGGSVTRGMVAVILYRLEGDPEVEVENSFPDVPAESWYAKGVTWACQKGFFNGYEDGTFGPEDQVTREQLATVFFRYGASLGMDIQGTSPLPMGTQVTSWAKGAVSWAWGNGLLYAGLGLDFQDPACRGEVAYLLSGFLRDRSLTGFTEETFHTGSGDVSYLLYTPKNAAPGLPLLVYLHGNGGKGGRLSLLTEVEGFPKYLKEGELGELNAYVLMPQLSREKRSWGDEAPMLNELIQGVADLLEIDRERISLTGHSLGGTGTWELALAYPTLFYRIAPLSGNVARTEENLNLLSRMGVWAVTGANDTIVPTKGCQALVKGLQDRGADARLTVLDRTDHFGVPKIYLDREIDLVGWLLGEK